MKIRYFLLLAAILITIISCKKDGGALSIKLQSVSSNIVPVGSDLSITLQFTSTGSPIDTIFMNRFRINQDSASVPTVTTESIIIPASYPGSAKGQLQFDLDYNLFLATAQTPPTYGNPPQNESDSMIFKFIAKDAANHVSDTVTTGLIVIQR